MPCTPIDNTSCRYREYQQKRTFYIGKNYLFFRYRLKVQSIVRMTDRGLASGNDGALTRLWERHPSRWLHAKAAPRVAELSAISHSESARKSPTDPRMRLTKTTVLV